MQKLCEKEEQKVCAKDLVYYIIFSISDSMAAKTALFFTILHCIF